MNTPSPIGVSVGSSQTDDTDTPDGRPWRGNARGRTYFASVSWPLFPSGQRYGNLPRSSAMTVQGSFFRARENWRRTMKIKLPPKEVTDSGKVRLGGFSPSL